MNWDNGNKDKKTNENTSDIAWQCSNLNLLPDNFRKFKNKSSILIIFFKPLTSKIWHFWYLNLSDFQVVYERNLSKHRRCIDIEQWLLVRLEKWIFTMYQILWWGSSVHIQALHPSQVSSLDCLRNSLSKIIQFSRFWDIACDVYFLCFCQGIYIILLTICFFLE